MASKRRLGKPVCCSTKTFWYPILSYWRGKWGPTLHSHSVKIGRKSLPKLNASGTSKSGCSHCSGTGRARTEVVKQWQYLVSNGYSLAELHEAAMNCERVRLALIGQVSLRNPSTIAIEGKMSEIWSNHHCTPLPSWQAWPRGASSCNSEIQSSAERTRSGVRMVLEVVVKRISITNSSCTGLDDANDQMTATVRVETARARVFRYQFCHDVRGH